jgi:hypothetical protein
MIIIVDCTECFSKSAWRSLSPTCRVSLAGCALQLDLLSDNLCPKNDSICMSNDNGKGRLFPLPCGRSLLPNLFSASTCLPLLSSVPSYFLPFISSRHFPSPFRPLPIPSSTFLPPFLFSLKQGSEGCPVENFRISTVLYMSFSFSA